MTDLRFTVRHARAADVEPLQQLRRTAGWGERDVAGWLDDAVHGKRENWVAERDGVIVGMVSLKLVDVDPEVADGKERAEISSLAVLPSARGLGLGRELTRIAEARAVERGFPIVTLNTPPENAVALHLYETMGYREFKRCQRDWGFAVHLQRRLSPR